MTTLEEYRNQTGNNVNSITNQEILRKLVDREIIHLASTLVYELAKKAEEFPDYYDDLIGAFEGVPDYEEAAIAAGWRETHEGTDEIENGNYVDENGLDDFSNADDWEELCNEQDIDAYEFCPDIYEHWIVTDWLADKLETHGHKVMRDFFGMTVWCRPTTGQAILLDGVIAGIAAEMEILQGQKNEWK